MKIVCAASVPYAREAFSEFGELLILPDRQIERRHLLDADALIVRSKTRVDEKLLEGTAVHFVATATAGTDHFDLPWLHSTGTAWTDAAGCNANAVAEYTLAALAMMAERTALPLAGRRLGIIGVGHVGGRVAEKAGLAGMRLLKNDPPKALREAAAAADYVALPALLEAAEAITLHTPLKDDGAFPTAHLANSRFFERMNVNAWLLNTSRGGVVETDALQCALQHDCLGACILDVWEDEPCMPPGLPEQLLAATPHIAGYSLEGLLNGTVYAYREWCRYLEKEPTWQPPADALPVPPALHCDAAGLSDDEALAGILAAACPIKQDSAAWAAEVRAAGTDRADLCRRFDHIRRTYHPRREFAAHRIHVANASARLLDILAALGFQICTHPA